MCKFKHCEGPHACFLRDISPCPEASQAETIAPEPSNRNHGFVDHPDLVESLEIVETEDALGKQLKQIRVSSKILRAIEVLGQRNAS